MLDSITTLPGSPIEIQGVKCKIAVDDRGQFIPEVDDRGFRADTLKGLKEQIARDLAKKKVKISPIPITLLYGKEPADGEATGIHRGTGKVLVRKESRYGRKGYETVQLDHYGSRSVSRRLSAEEKAEWKRLDEEAKAATKALKSFEDRVEINIFQEVKDRIDEATAREVEKAAKS